MSSAVPFQPPLRWWNQAWRLLVVLLISGAAVLTTYQDHTPDPGWQPPSTGKAALDVGLGVLSLALVLGRRRWPFAVAAATTVLSGFSTLAGGPAVLALVSLATRRRWIEVIPLWVASVASGELMRWWLPTPDDLSWWGTGIVVAALTGGCIAWGFYIGSRRELLWTWEDRATRAEAENELRAAKARGDERARIAREMHDVLAHKISQVSMLSGALAYRRDLDPQQVQRNAELIQTKANEALAELREVLGVLRDPGTGELLHRPQPSHVDLPELFEESRNSGMRLEVDFDPPTWRELPEAVGRTVYRTVQEGLTNARKHADGALVTVRLSGDPDSGVTVEVSNPLGFGDAALPGSGLGLIGLAERFAAADGELVGQRVGHRFVLRGWLPWSA